MSQADVSDETPSYTTVGTDNKPRLNRFYLSLMTQVDVIWSEIWFSGEYDAVSSCGTVGTGDEPLLFLVKGRMCRQPKTWFSGEYDSICCSCHRWRGKATVGGMYLLSNCTVLKFTDRINHTFAWAIPNEFLLDDECRQRRLFFPPRFSPVTAPL